MLSLLKNILTKSNPIGLILTYWKPLAIALLCGVIALYSYRAGGKSVEADYDALRAAQRANAATASENYQGYRKNTDMTKIRKELEHEIRKSPAACIVNSDRRLLLYKAAGVRNAAP